MGVAISLLSTPSALHNHFFLFFPIITHLCDMCPIVSLHNLHSFFCLPNSSAFLYTPIHTFKIVLCFFIIFLTRWMTFNNEYGKSKSRSFLIRLPGGVVCAADPRKRGNSLQKKDRLIWGVRTRDPWICRWEIFLWVTQPPFRPIHISIPRNSPSLNQLQLIDQNRNPKLDCRII